MNDLQRLSNGSDLGATLLRSARADRVPEGAAARAVSAVLVGAAAGAAPAAGGSALHRLGLIAKAPAAKLTYLAVSLLIAGGAVVATRAPSSTEPVERANVSAPPRAFVTAPTTATVELRPPPSSDAVPTLRLEDLPQVHASPLGAGPALVPTVATSVPVAPEGSVPVVASAAPTIDSTLAEEVRALDGVRSALKAGDAAGALSKLASYEASFPKKQLGHEAAVLRERALQLQNPGKERAP